MDHLVPEEFGGYRLGTAVNADLGEVSADWRALDMGLLAGAGALNWNLNTESEKWVRAGGYTAESQDTWALGLDSSTSFSFANFSTVQANFHMARSSNVAQRASGQTITAVARYLGSVSIVNPTGDLLLKCATETFTATYGAICEAAKATRDAERALEAARGASANDAAAVTRAEQALGQAEHHLEEALVLFYRRYGTGFISKLRLGACGVFEGTVAYTSSFEQTHASYGGSLSVGGIGGNGFAAAAEFAQSRSKADARAQLTCECRGFPIQSAPAQWAESLMNQFDGHNLSEMGNLKAWEPAEQKVAAVHAVVPKIEQRTPAAEVPKFPGGDIDTQVKNMKLREFRAGYRKQYGREPEAGQYEQWLRQLKTAAAKDDDAIAAVAPARAGAK